MAKLSPVAQLLQDLVALPSPGGDPLARADALLRLREFLASRGLL